MTPTGATSSDYPIARNTFMAYKMCFAERMINKSDAEFKNEMSSILAKKALSGVNAEILMKLEHHFNDLYCMWERVRSCCPDDVKLLLEHKFISAHGGHYIQSTLTFDRDGCVDINLAVDIIMAKFGWQTHQTNSYFFKPLLIDACTKDVVVGFAVDVNVPNNSIDNTVIAFKHDDFYLFPTVIQMLKSETLKNTLDKWHGTMFREHKQQWKPRRKDVRQQFRDLLNKNFFTYPELIDELMAEVCAIHTQQETHFPIDIWQQKTANILQYKSNTFVDAELTVAQQDIAVYQFIRNLANRLKEHIGQLSDEHVTINAQWTHEHYYGKDIHGLNIPQEYVYTLFGIKDETTAALAPDNLNILLMVRDHNGFLFKPFNLSWSGTSFSTCLEQAKLNNQHEDPVFFQVNTGFNESGWDGSQKKYNKMYNETAHQLYAFWNNQHKTISTEGLSAISWNGVIKIHNLKSDKYALLEAIGAGMVVLANSKYNPNLIVNNEQYDLNTPFETNSLLEVLRLRLKAEIGLSEIKHQTTLRMLINDLIRLEESPNLFDSLNITQRSIGILPLFVYTYNDKKLCHIPLSSKCLRSAPLSNEVLDASITLFVSDMDLFSIQLRIYSEVSRDLIIPEMYQYVVLKSGV